MHPANRLLARLNAPTPDQGRVKRFAPPAAKPPQGESKTFSGEVKAVAGKGPRVRRFIITTDTIDRDGDVVLPKGLELDEYRRNPVLLWSHRFDMPPIGKCLDLGLAGDHVVWADFEFAEHEFAEQVFKLYSGGYLNACSIGFRTLQSGPPDSSIFMSRPQDASRCQRVIYRALLLEVSAVPIPANPDALMVAVQKGLLTTSRGDRDRMAKALASLRDPRAIQSLVESVLANMFQELRRKGVVVR
jgi:HK97 family phage prohead protease